MFVIPDTKCVIRDVQLVIPDAKYVIPDPGSESGAGPIRDPVPHHHWIAGRGPQ